ncbi:MAG: hypothetical protein JRJ73_14610 [Deltaproteobacteria bacterium]|nr:hypothetical protein [Deltaproteobacteria bacterium]
MKAEIYFTAADEKLGFPATKRALKAETTENLLREYREGIKHGFDPIFGKNCRKFTNLIVDELYAREITDLKDIFGVNSIKKWGKTWN